MECCRSVFEMLFLILLVLRPCDSEVKANLKGVVGLSITFPDSVKERGFFNFVTKTIASVYNGVFEIEENIYLNRIHWNSSGHFTLSDLKKNDSGVYTIASKKGRVFTNLYELRVYDAVSAPVVSCVNVSESSVSLQCSLTETEQTTLHWLKGEENVSSSDSGELLLTALRLDHNSEYKCVARNPAQTKNITVNVNAVCKINETLSSENENLSGTILVSIIVGVIGIVVLTCLAFFWLRRRKPMELPSSLHPQECIQYAQINHRKRKVNQNSPNPSGVYSRPPLTSLYDEVQLHRMSPIYTNHGNEIA